MRRAATYRRLAASVAAVLLGFVAGGQLWRALAPRVSLRAPAPTILLQDAGGRYLAELGGTSGHGYWPPGDTIPERVVRTTLAAEDARFDAHAGVDARAVARAAYQNVRRLRVVEGASTLAMQVARMQAPGPRSLVRKLTEALVGLALTWRFGRDAVLRHYLAIAPYGNEYHGVAYAARRYFDKPLADLTWAEAALLAALPRLPGRMNVYQEAGRRRAEQRARYVISRLSALGWITPADAAVALDQLPGLKLCQRGARPPAALHAILAFQRRYQARRLGSAGTRIVRAALDLELQNAVHRMAQAAMPGLRADGAGNAAVVVLEKSTGLVRAYLGSADFHDVANKGSIDYARVPRSPGSALKPFIFGLGMSLRGFTGATILSDVGLVMDTQRGGYAVKNYDGGYLGPIPYRNALANSRNIPAVEVLSAVGVDRALAHFAELGLARGYHDPRRYGLSLALGALDVTLFDLVRAYGTLAREGMAMTARWTLASPSPRPTRLVPADVARQLTQFLSDPIARLPSFPRLGWLEYPFPVAVKTGTSQGFRDAWCVAYSQEYVVGAWIGHPDNVPMKRRAGADSAAALVHRVMAHLHPVAMRGLADLAFQPPPEFISKKIDMLTGQLARDDTPFTAVEWFRPGTEPVALTDAYARSPAGHRCVNLPPRYAAWARESGLELLPLTGAASLGLRSDPELKVVAPRQAARVLRDPETPRAQSTIALEASVTPPAPQVAWYVDGRLLCVADYPYTARWRATPGDHVFQVGLPYAPLRSARVSVTFSE